MSSPYVGEIRMFAGNFAPAGWALCNGALLPISSNEALFNLIGTTYGGDGQSVFALPDLRSRLPMHVGPGYSLGQAAGAESITLTVAQLPAHSHVPVGSTGANTNAPANAVWGQPASLNLYAEGGNTAGQMSPYGILNTGGSQAHDNMCPFLAINFILSLFGIYPSQ